MNVYLVEYSGLSSITKTLQYKLVGNVLHFSYNGTDYSIEFIKSRDAIEYGDIELVSNTSMRKGKAGYVNYSLRIHYVYGGKNGEFIYFFDSIDLLKGRSLKIRLLGGKHRWVEADLLTAKRGNTSDYDGIISRYSISSGFTHEFNISELTSFDWRNVNYVLSDGRLIMDIGVGYLMIEEDIFEERYIAELGLSGCYGSSYNGYDYYAIEQNGYDREYRFIVDSGKLVFSTREGVVVLNKRLI